MTSMFMTKRGIKFVSLLNSHCFLTRASCCLSSRSSTVHESSQAAPLDDAQSSNTPNPTHGYDIELVDHDVWQVSSSLARAWNGKDWALETRLVDDETGDDPLVDYSSTVEELCFDEIDDMRVRGSLFYKLDRDSKEFEEYNYDFHRKKSSKNKNDDRKENQNEHMNPKPPKAVEKKCVTTSPVSAMDKNFDEKKKLRTLTYNQLTGPYHEPFCLDIFISKGSIRACIVHRATSNVVAVAHSISKDMKYDLASTKDAKACVHVGSVLAQRVLEDDIHDVIYTPRKGERLEGKLQIVLQAVIDNGVNVKVKIKKRNMKAVRLITE